MSGIQIRIRIKPKVKLFNSLIWKIHYCTDYFRDVGPGAKLVHREIEIHAQTCFFAARNSPAGLYELMARKQSNFLLAFLIGWKVIKLDEWGGDWTVSQLSHPENDIQEKLLDRAWKSKMIDTFHWSRSRRTQFLNGKGESRRTRRIDGIEHLYLGIGNQWSYCI